MGDILTAGAIGAFVGIENVVIISISAIILGKIITYFTTQGWTGCSIKAG